MSTKPTKAPQKNDDVEDRTFNCNIVCIGASAGGLESIERFFQDMPESTNTAFVVIQHLSPNFKSFMPEILSKKTHLQVKTVENGMEVLPNTIYLLPPKMNMTLDGSRLQLEEIVRTSMPNKPIDIFLESMARSNYQRKIAIILSGTGTDGSLGIGHVHEVGGRVYVESVGSAKFDGMPLAAIATDLYDYIGTAEEIARAIFSTNPSSEVVLSGDYEFKKYKVIFDKIYSKFGIDFNKYKIGTISRRISKRLAYLNLKSIAEYLQYIDLNPDEIKIIFNEMLIGVTRFNRDADAFEVLRSYIRNILKSKAQDDTLRIWTAGCASGEETYSIAIMAAEEIEASSKKIDLKIFASDIQEASLDKAANGVYKAADLADMDPLVIEKYFKKQGHNYKVRQYLRSRIVFARHNLLNDPPFTKMDLVSCRNLLIYFDPDAQDNVLRIFNFSLVSSGILFLGPSEAIGGSEIYFTTLDSKWKIFQKQNNLYHLRDGRHIGTAHRQSNYALGRGAVGSRERSDAVIGKKMQEDIYQVLLETFVPAGVLINENMDLIHIYGSSPFAITLKSGKVSNNLKSFVDDTLFTAISVSVQRAKREQSDVVYQGLQIADETMDFKVTPIQTSNAERSRVFLISLEHRATDVDHSAKVVISQSKDLTQVALLEEELRNTRENLQTTIEELEATNEELQSTNEELLASNEELQSTNEELQSVNEELHTVNAEYQIKLDELAQMSVDEENYFKSTGVGTVFIDKDLCIRKFTPTAADCFDLLQQDIGRSFIHFAHTFEGIDLKHEIEKVFETGKAQEHEVKSKIDGFPYWAKILPYSSVKNTIQGVVISFLNIKEVNDATEKLKSNELLLSQAQKLSNTGAWSRDVYTNVVTVSDQWQKIFNYPARQINFDDFVAMVHPDDQEKVRERHTKILQGNTEYDLLYRIFPRGSDTPRWVRSAASTHKFKDTSPTTIFGSAQDVTQFVLAERELKQQNAILNFITKETNDGWWDWNLKTDEEYMSERFWLTFGIDPATKRHHASEWQDIIHPDDLALAMENFKRHAETNGEHPYYQEVRYRHTEGHWVHVICRGRVVEWDRDQTPLRMVGVHTDVTRLKRQERLLLQTNSELEKSNEDLERFAYIASHDLKAPLRGMLALKQMLDMDLAEYFAAETPKSAEVRANLEKIDQQSRRMMALVKGILDYSKSTRTEDAEEQVSVHHLIVDTAHENGWELGRSLLMAEELPEIYGPVVRLKQVFSNLIGNGFKYNPNPESAVVEVSCVASDDELKFVIEDNGPGIEEKYHDRIFEMFFTPQSQGEIESSGIGLALVKRIVEAHHGRVGLESWRGKGTRFWFTWPKKPVV